MTTNTETAATEMNRMVQGAVATMEGMRVTTVTTEGATEGNVMVVAGGTSVRECEAAWEMTPAEAMTEMEVTEA